MDWFFNLIYAAGLVVGSPLLLWRWLLRRKPIAGWITKLTGTVVVSGSRPRIWLHAVSVGEVNLLAILLPALRRRLPDYDFVVSTTTGTGHEVATKRFGENATVVWFPWDFSWAVRRAIDRIQPRLVILSELELWPNFLRISARRSIPVAVVNGRLSERSARGYRRFRIVLGRAFSSLRFVAAQNKAYSERFVELGVPPEHVRVVGNIKFDGAEFDRANPRTAALAGLIERRGDETYWLAGSTQHPEEVVAVQVYSSLRSRFPRLRLVLAPRHPERAAAVAGMVVDHDLRCIRRSRLVGPTSLDSGSVLLIDTVGELASWWGLSQIAFVGGSLGNRGGQNMIEPAAFASALAFGPNTGNFRDAVRLLLDAQAAVVVHDRDELEGFVRDCLENPAAARQLGTRARRVVSEQSGACAETVESLAQLLAVDAAATGRAA